MSESLPFAKRNHRGIDTRRSAFPIEEYRSISQYSEDEYASSDYEYTNRALTTKNLRSLAIQNSNHIKLNRRFYSQMVGNTTDRFAKSDSKDEEESADNTSYITFNEVYKNNLASMEPQDDSTEEIEGRNSSGSIVINEMNRSRHYVDDNSDIENDDEDDMQTEDDDITYPLLNNENQKNYKTVDHYKGRETTNGTFKSISSVVKSFFKNKYGSAEDLSNSCDEDIDNSSELDNNVIDIMGMNAACIDPRLGNDGFLITEKLGDTVKLQKNTANNLVHHKNKLQKLVSRSGSSKNNSIRTLKVDKTMHKNEGSMEDTDNNMGNGIIYRNSNSMFGDRSILVWSEEDEENEINSVFIEARDGSSRPFLVNCIMVVCTGLIFVLTGFLAGVLMANLVVI